MAPRRNPDIVVAVLCEHGGWGAEAAAPLAAQVINAFVTKQRKRDNNLRIAAVRPPPPPPNPPTPRSAPRSAPRSTSRPVPPSSPSSNPSPIPRPYPRPKPGPNPSPAPPAPPPSPPNPPANNHSPEISAVSFFPFTQ
jgi:penicillin-binding protein 2